MFVCFIVVYFFLPLLLLPLPFPPVCQQKINFKIPHCKQNKKLEMKAEEQRKRSKNGEGRKEQGKVLEKRSENESRFLAPIFYTIFFGLHFSMWM